MRNTTPRKSGPESAVRGLTVISVQILTAEHVGRTAGLRSLMPGQPGVSSNYNKHLLAHIQTPGKIARRERKTPFRCRSTETMVGITGTSE